MGAHSTVWGKARPSDPQVDRVCPTFACWPSVAVCFAAIVSLFSWHGEGYLERLRRRRNPSATPHLGLCASPLRWEAIRSFSKLSAEFSHVYLVVGYFAAANAFLVRFDRVADRLSRQLLSRCRQIKRFFQIGHKIC